jgi:hypothetical protein
MMADDYVAHRLCEHRQPLNGADTECDLAIEVGGARIADATRSFNKLLAEYPG